MDWFLYDNGLRHERVKVHGYRPLVLSLLGCVIPIFSYTDYVSTFRENT